jgi:hypothetical protein
VRARGEVRVSAAARRALLNGTAYVNVHTQRNEAGEIRGQVAVVEELAASLDVGQAVPAPDVAGAGGRGSFKAELLRTGAGRTLVWQLQVRGLSGRAVAAHVHVGAVGKTGAVLVPLCSPCGSRARGEVRVNARAARALSNGTAYVNVHTQRNEAGEIRGQISVKAG